MRAQTEHWILLLKRIGFVTMLYTLCRFIFFLFTASSFTQQGFSPVFWAFVHGVRFDLSALLYMNFPLIVFHLLPFNFRNRKGYQSFLLGLFVIVNIVALLFNIGDIVNFGFSGKRLTADFFSFISQGDDAKNLGFDFALDNWYLLIIVATLLWAMFRFYPRMSNHSERLQFNLKTVLIQFLIIGTSISFCALGMRGGLQYKPIKIIDASRNIHSSMIPLVLNTPFTIMQTLGKADLEERNYMPTEIAEANYSALHQYPSDTLKPYNVVVIIMESFSKEYIGALNDFDGYTPFLDSLIDQSLVFENSFANGKRSIEGVPSIIASIPALMDNPYITSSYGANSINSLPSMLNDLAYQTAFFHGGNNGTMGFDAFAELADYQKYYGRNEYNNDAHYDGNWGIFDEHFFQYFAQECDRATEPFFHTFFSLSSHHPYTIPEEYKDRFTEGEIPIHKTIAYADFALKGFFDTASKMDWFDNTLFVITADHTFYATHDSYKNKVGTYSIPLIFYHSGKINAFRSKRYSQQIDIMPSVMNYLGYDTPFIAFGESVFNELKPGFAINYINNTYQLIKDGYVLHFNGENSTALYALEKDPLLQENLIETEPELSLHYEKAIQAIIQEYNNRLINNRMTPTLLSR